MNAKTAKRLRKYASEVGENYSAVKRLWNKTPRPQRGKVRAQVLPGIEAMHEKLKFFCPQRVGQLPKTAKGSTP